MQKIITNGPCKLSGKVAIQGAKNTSNKNILLSVLSNGKVTLNNVPHIGTCTNLVDLITRHGAKTKWITPNQVTIESKEITADLKLGHDEFYYTSGGIHLVPLLTSKYGKYTVPAPYERGNIGGDNIGGRQIEYLIEQMESCGIESVRTDKEIMFELKSKKGFKYEVPVRSYAASLNALIAAIYKNGTSEIINYTTDIEFQSILEYLVKMGADIKISKDVLRVTGGKELKGVEYTNPSDRNDFATWVALALASNSELLIENIDYEKMGLCAMESVIDEMGAELEYTSDTCLVKKHNGKLKPVDIFANRYPDFQTEWQVVFSPLLTQIEGTSSVIEAIYPDRMGHWNELKKMGARCEFIKDRRVPEKEDKPRAVRVHGITKLSGTELECNDLRRGACMVIAGLIADGRSEISGIEHIFRGYEDFVERLQEIGASIEIEE